MLEISDFVGIDPNTAVIRSVLGSAPAAGAEIAMSVPGGRAWLLLAFSVVLVSDANAANRRPSLVIRDGNSILARLPSQAVQAASQTVRFTWGSGSGDNGDGTAAQSMGLFRHAVLLGGWTLTTVTGAVQATDAYGVPAAWVVEFDINR